MTAPDHGIFLGMLHCEQCGFNNHWEKQPPTVCLQCSAPLRPVVLTVTNPPPASPTNPLLTSDTLGVEAPTDREQEIEARLAGLHEGSDIVTTANALIEDVAYLLARVRSLQRYAQHPGSCAARGGALCSCGLDALRAAHPIEAPANGQ